MNEKAIKSFLESEEGKRNAERFLKALKEGRIIVSIPHVSNTGMSRIIRFREVVNLRSRIMFNQQITELWSTRIF